jgi:predicted transcriptional regulator
VVERQYSALAQPGAPLEKLLGDLEREIMEAMWARMVWSRSAASVREVLTEINERHPPGRQLAYTTVMTVMARLVEKGLLKRRRVGRADEYEAADTREAFLARASQDIARRMVQDFGEAAVAGFLSVLEEVAPDRLAKLRRQAQRRDQA